MDSILIRYHVSSCLLWSFPMIKWAYVGLRNPETVVGLSVLYSVWEFCRSAMRLSRDPQSVLFCSGGFCDKISAILFGVAEELRMENRDTTVDEYFADNSNPVPQDIYEGWFLWHVPLLSKTRFDVLLSLHEVCFRCDIFQSLQIGLLPLASAGAKNSKFEGQGTAPPIRPSWLWLCVFSSTAVF